MIKNKIALRLLVFFSTGLVIFALIIGCIFAAVSTQQTMEHHREELKTRAMSIAETMYGFLSGDPEVSTGGGNGKNQNNKETGTAQNSETNESLSSETGGTGQKKGQGNGNGQKKGNPNTDTDTASVVSQDTAEACASEESFSGSEEETAETAGETFVHLPGSGFGAYMRYLEDIAMADVWVVDSQSKTITPGSGHMGTISYSELPKDGEALIDQALQGEISFSESFSSLLGEKTISVGVPIQGDTGAAPLGAVLLHSPVQGVSDTVQEGLRTLLISLVTALLLAIPAALLLSLKFTRPLNHMKENADRIAQGDFSAKNNIPPKDEIGQLACTMDQMADKLEAASQESRRLEQMRRDFISNISHELRTPVTVLRGSLEALKDGIITEPEQVAEYHSQMLRESMHLQRLVDDLLELSRLQNMDFKIEMAPLELHQLVDDVARGMRRVADPKGVMLETNCEEKEFAVLGDYGRLRQMLIVITDNAVKFSPGGEKVVMSLFEKDGHPAISVSDHGPGIAPEDLPKIFQRFQRNRGEENKTGTGLGLPIAKQIAQRHNIHIEVTSNTSGTTFLFLFPVDSSLNKKTTA